jgi:hypothetical protein
MGSYFRIDKPQRSFEPIDALQLMQSEGQCHGSADRKDDERSKTFEDLRLNLEEDLVEKLNLTVRFEPLIVQC